MKVLKRINYNIRIKIAFFEIEVNRLLLMNSLLQHVFPSLRWWVHTTFLVCVASVSGYAQVNSRSEVSYTFDQHTFEEDNHQLRAKPVGVMLVEDRFGNDRSAVCLNGHINSYLNLGVSPLLQPKTATISLWVKINSRVYNGKGADGNPILLIKNGPSDDYYTAYGIFYSEMKTFLTMSTKDSLTEAILAGVNQVKFGQWYHLLITSDNHSFAFYVNGNLQGRCKKDFETQFLATDSMVIGHTANKKNVRYTLGVVDDIRIFHRILNDAEIKGLYEAPNPNRTTLMLQRILYWGGLLAAVFVVAFLLVWQRRRKLQRAGQQLDLQRKLHEMEIRTLKAQMNPHFIFNALNAIQVFIMNVENDKAELYLSKFSKLMRELLESNTNESLTVPEEKAILHGYLELESLRFGKSFAYEIHVAESIDNAEVRIPHMMIQPFVENAIWHGLLAKKNERKLTVSLAVDSPRTIRCVIDDNGVGREVSGKKEHTMKKKSLALSIVRQRLELMNVLLNVNCSVELIDKVAADGLSSGTRVVVTLPILAK
jgi:hypothetical protein